MDPRPDDEFAYIRFSAKELLLRQTELIDRLSTDVVNIRLNMVTRTELQSARRWAYGASMAAFTALTSIAAVIAGVRF